MVRRPDAERIEAVVRDWQGPVYGLAVRMLGDRAEAEDATQEAFLRAFQRWDRFDPAREPGPWIYRVATRVLLNRLRAGRARKKAHDRLAAIPPRPAAEEDPVERAERERVVEEHVRRLPPEERAAVVLHYYAGLPQAEVAAALDEPRSTVQSRVARGLDALRDSLRSGGHAGLVPAVDAVMRGAPAPVAPAHLAPAIVEAAVSGAAVPAALVVGGVVVTQKLVLAVLAAALLLVGGGFAAGRVTAPDPAESDAKTVARLAEAESERDRLRGELDRRSSQALASATRGPGSVDPSATGHADVGASASTGAASAAPSTAAAAPPSGAVDWSRFGKLLAESVDALVAAEENEDEDLDPETKQKIMAILVEYQKAAAEARALSPKPFFDARVLPGFADAVVAIPLGLSADARAALDASVRASLDAAREDVAAAEGRPVAVHAARRRIVDAILESSRRVAPDAPADRRAKVEGLARALLAGDRSTDSVSVATPGGEARLAQRVVETWQRDLKLDDRQVELVRPIAQAFARAAVDVWTRHGVDARSSPETVAAAERDVLRALVEAERALDGVLTPEQRTRAANRRPSLFFPTSSETDHSMTTMGDGI
jgi:RNA polymerase sigma-70 factor (ECF subfamily)